MDPHTAEAFAWMIGIAGFWLIAVLLTLVFITRRPRKADRAYHASLREVAASYEDEGVHGDVVIVPFARPFAEEGGPSRG